MQNKAILLGNVGHAPDIRTSTSGDIIATFSLATSKSWKDKATGERKTATQWHRIVVFNQPLAKYVESYVGKGAKLYVEGEIETRKWTDRQGIERYVTEIVLRPFSGEITSLDRREGNSPPPADSPDSYGSSSSQPPQNDGMADDIPF